MAEIGPAIEQLAGELVPAQREVIAHLRDVIGDPNGDPLMQLRLNSAADSERQTDQSESLLRDYPTGCGDETVNFPTCTTSVISTMKPFRDSQLRDSPLLEELSKRGLALASDELRRLSEISAAERRVSTQMIADSGILASLAECRLAALRSGS